MRCTDTKMKARERERDQDRTESRQGKRRQLQREDERNTGSRCIIQSRVTKTEDRDEERRSGP